MKAQALSVGEKLKMIEVVRTFLRKKKDIVEEFVIGNSTFSAILKNEGDAVWKTCR